MVKTLKQADTADLDPELEPAPQPSALLADKVRRLRGKVVSNGVLTSLSVAILVGVEFLGLVMFFDWLFELPWWVRAVLLAIQVVALGWILARHVINPLINQPDDDQLAILVEKARPQLRTRLIASVQLTRPGAVPAGASASFVEALVTETETIAAGIDFNGIVSSERLRVIGTAACCVAAVALFAFLYARPASPQLLKRALLSNAPVPRKTSVEVLAGNKVVGKGDDVLIEARATGIMPERGVIEVQFPDRRLQTYVMERTNANFARTIENVQESFSYSVRLNDGRSESFQVKVLARPAVSSISCEQRFPAYTQLPDRILPANDLSLLAGSTLDMKVVSTKDVSRAEIRLVGLSSNVTMTVMGPRQLRGQFRIPAKGINGFSIELLDTDGMASKDAAVYRVDIVPDKPPAVRITAPSRREELFTKQATALVAMEVSDDFQIAKLRLRYKADPASSTAAIANPQPPSTIDLDIGPEPLTALKRRFEWNLRYATPDLATGSRIEFWIEAEDNNDVTGPGVGQSDHYFARLVTDEEKRADLWNRAADTLSGINDLANDQQKLTENLGALIRDKARSP